MEHNRTLPIISQRRLRLILITTVCILSIPFVAMQFTQEVNWSTMDFAIAGILLVGTGLLLEVAFRMTAQKTIRILISIAIVLLLLLVWAELAVGIFGTPFAGS